MKQNITIYTTMMCPVCMMAKDFLSNMNVEYKEVNVDLKPLEMIKLIGKTRRLSVPQMYVNGQWIVGFDPVRVLETLNVKEC